VKYANAYLGGVGGHVIELDECIDRSDGVSGQACANQFVDDKVAGVIEGSVGDSTPYVTTLTKAGIPWIALTGLTPAEFTGSTTFLFTAGVLGQLGSIAQYAVDHNFKRVTVIGINVAGVSAVLKSFAAPLFAAAGITLDSSLVPPGTPDPTPQVTAALQHNPDGVVVYADAPTCRGVIPALAGGTTPDGKKPTVFITNVCIDQEVLKTVPAGDFDGVQLPAWIGPTGSDAETTLYDAVLAKYLPSADSSDGDTAHGYIVTLAAIRALNQVSPSVGTDAASVVQGLRAAVKVPVPLGDGSTFTCDGKAIPAFIAMCSGQVVSAQLVDAKPNSFSVIDASELIAKSFAQ
jgi:branched-chain amino acid transport system substrate-binding protein